MCFHLYSSTQHSLILGFPWLKEHNPHIDWCTGRVLNWADSYNDKCLTSCHDLNVKTVFNAVSVNCDTDSETSDLTSVPRCYHDLGEVFSKSNATSLPPHRPYDCPIDLIPGAPIPKGRLYTISGPERKAMTECIESSLKAGLIRPFHLQLGQGSFLWGKKMGLSGHALTMGHSMRLPLKIGTLCHLVRIREGDEWKTGFNTPSGHYEYLVMPFGLTNAPAVFQAMINDVLRDFLNHFVYVYLDDILIFSPDSDSHVRQILQQLLENQLYVKAEKSEFHADTVSFLGFIIAPGKMQMDPAKVSAVAQWRYENNITYSNRQ